MAHHNGERKDLSVSWPFTTAGFAITLALAWFCLGFAIRDRKPIEEGQTVEGPIELSGHFPVFWSLLLVAAVLIVGGIIFNVTRARRRFAALQ